MLSRTAPAGMSTSRQAPGFQAPGQVAQRACVHQLPDDARACPRVAADEVNEPEAVGPEPGDVRVLHEVLALHAQRVVLFPVAPDGQDVVRTALDGHHVRQGHAVFVLVPGHLPVDVDLKDLIPVVLREGEPLVLGLLLLDVGVEAHRFAQVDVAVEPRDLQALEVVLGLAHDVRHALSGVHVGRAVGNDQVFRRHVGRVGQLRGGVRIYLLERSADQAQAEQQALVLRAVVDHALGERVVHVLPDALCGLLLGLGDLAHDLGLHRPLGRERLSDHL
jgi:hypothetical protein